MEKPVKAPLRILYLEDDPRDAELVQETLSADGVESEIIRVETEAGFIVALKEGGLDLVLADHTLPSFDGLSALAIVKKDWPELPLIFVSGTLGEEVAIEALKNGATDYVFKTRLSRIVPSVQRALREAEERSELIRAQEALLQSEAYLAEAQRISHIGSFGWDLASGRIYWSQETYRIFEYDPVIEPNLDLVLARIHPEDKAMVQQLVERVSNERTDFDFEHRLLMPNGAVKYVRVAARPSKCKSGSFEFMGLVSDITDRKLGEEALQKAHAELAHITRVTTLGELTASIAHEINQPLTAIVNNANACRRLLAVPAPDLDEVRQAVTDIADLGTRAGEVIARVRTFMKKTIPMKTQVDLNLVISDVLALIPEEPVTHKISVVTELRPGLPPVLGDRIQLQQVMLNLIMNGIESMTSIVNRPRVLLIRSQVQESGHVLVMVQDSGAGLDTKSVSHIFDTFYTTKPSGMGMGLAISRSIVEAHGGRLWPVADAREGAIFNFTLPACA